MAHSHRERFDCARTPHCRAARQTAPHTTGNIVDVWYHHWKNGLRKKPTAMIAESARLGTDVTIEAYAVIGEEVVIGDRGWIGAHVVVGDGTTMGSDVRLYASATVYPHVELGDRVILHAGARVGRDGFGFRPGPAGPVRVPHVGRCVLESDVEVGANSCIDRGSIDDTIIGAFTKLDSLVHVAHNVRVGKGCFMAMGVGIAGSSRIGDGVQFGGQSGAGNHSIIGERCACQADVLRFSGPSPPRAAAVVGCVGPSR